MARSLVWLAAIVVALAATGGLLWFSTVSAARFSVEGDMLHVSGQLTLASTERLNVILEENGDLSTLVLGDIAEGSDMTALLQKGLLVRQAGLSTEVAPGATLSGDAVYLFLAGITRGIGPGGRVAVTGWDTPAGPAARLPRDHPAHSERRDYVGRMLGSDDFYWFTLEAPGEMPYVMTPADLAALDVATMP
ncbi:hypothetical protein P6F26_15200 [Roseibacterium sp. SDUM158017]|uniref:hypothetical protein n=1 Tax=Roseicyclus salinarum TaxID=3036773 RepID=UPI00241564C1|nr:hypothetical protein [Roseibacterium sp. SDUM158017]MDG4649790.1 hypothetical protein [Roseibacterium sp. SDUM158017]